METCGFRICIKLCLQENEDSKKCFIFINSRWSTIKDVLDHIKHIFSIDEDINIYVDDVLLPENETIKLIQHNDILILKLECKKPTKESTKWDITEDINVNTNRSKKSKKSKIHNGLDDNEALLSECIEELRTKREQLSNTNNSDVNPVSILNDSSTGLDSLYEIPRTKKRKRKHKKKNKLDESDNELETLHTDKADLVIPYAPQSSRKHIYFTEKENNEILADSASKETDSTVGEVRSAILQLLDKPPSEKVYSRNSDIPKKNPKGKLQFDENDTLIANSDKDKIEVFKEVVSVPKVGDVILFKKMKLGDDYTPQKSGEITGKINSVTESAGSYVVVFDILEGADEFEEPFGKFSIETEDVSINETRSVEMNWNEVLEPCLSKWKN